MAGLGSSLLGDIGRTSARVTAKPKKRKPVRHATKKVPAAFGPISAQSNPLGTAQKQAAAKTRKADRAIPQKPSPRVPYILNPTEQQQRAAGKAVLKAVDEHVLKSPNFQPVNPNDPAAVELARTAQHYGRASARDRLEKIGRHAAAQMAPPKGKFGTEILEGLGAQRQKETVGLGESLLGEFGRGKSPLSRKQAISLGSQVVAGAIQAKEVHKEKKYIGIPGVPLARINLAPFESAAIQFVNKHTSLDQAGAGKFLKNAFGDVASLGEAPYVGGFALGEGAIAAAGGNWDPLKAQAQGTLEAIGQDPLVQLAGAGLGIKGASTKGALESFVSHPFFAALDADAGIGIAGRGVGALARGLGSTAESAGVRGSLARMGDTRRSPLALDDDPGLAAGGYVLDRHYSKDLTRRALQKGMDSLREPVRDATGKVVTVDVRKRQMPVLKSRGGSAGAPATTKVGRWAQEVKPSEQRRLQRARADYEAAATQGAETNARHLTDSEIHKLDKKTPAGKRLRGQVAQDIAGLITSGTVTSGEHLARDLTKRADRIEEALTKDARRVAAGEESVYATSLERKVAEDSVKTLRAAAGNPKLLARADKLAEVGIEHGRALNAAERDKLDTSIGDEEQFHRGRLTEYASAQMGARHFSEEEHAQLESAARKVEGAAQARVKAAKSPAEKRVALKEYRAARADRIAVSGRHPERVVSHERAQATLQRTQDARETATKAEYEAERKRSNLVAVQRSQRLTRQNQGRPSHATKAEVKELEDHTAAMHAARDAANAARAAEHAAIEAAHLNPLPEIKAGIRRPDGRHLPTEDIEAHARLHGRDPDTIAYLPHRTDQIGGEAFHKENRPGSRPTENTPRRTLHLYERGSNIFGRELAREQLTHHRTTVAKARALDRLVSSAGVLHPIMHQVERGGDEAKAVAGKLQRGERLNKEEREIAEQWSKEERAIIANKGRFTGPGALEAVRRLQAEGRNYVAVRESAAAPKDLRDAIRDANTPAAMEAVNQELLRSRLVQKGDADLAHNVVLMPGWHVQQLEAHLRPAGDLEKLVQMLNAPFRMAVLPQLRWLTGNIVEPYLIRLPLSGAGIFLPGAAVDARYASKYMNHLQELADGGNAGAARELSEVQAMLGGLFIGRKGASVRRTYEDLDVGSWERKAAATGHFLRNAPVAKQLADLALRIPQSFFDLNRHIESGAQRQALGKSIRRDVQEMSNSYAKTLRATGDLLNELGAGKLSAGTLQRWTKEQHDLLGKYAGFKPRTRRAIQSVVPFLPWSMAAARFVYITMPLHHTAATALLVKSSQAIADQWADMHEDLPPGSLKDAQVTKKGGLVDLARYTPYGFSIPVTQGQFEDIGDTFLPQVSSVFNAIKGQNPFGRELKVQPTADNPEGKARAGDILKIIANSLAEGFVPMLGIARRISEGGGTGYDNSNILSRKVKPGSKHMSGVRRALDPFRPTYLKDPVGSGGTAAPSGSRWGNGGSDAPAAAPARAGSRWG